MNIVMVMAMKNIEKTISLITPPVLILPRVIVNPLPIRIRSIKNRAVPENSRNLPAIPENLMCDSRSRPGTGYW